MSIDQHFNAMARQRKAAEYRAQFDDSGAKIIHIDSPLGTAPGEISAKLIREQLPTDKSEIVARIHTEGGSVFESFAIYDLFSAYPGKKRCEVSSMALSAGSLLLCAFDDVSVSPNAYCMMHNAHMEHGDVTTAEQQLLGSLSGRMTELYARRTRKPVSEIRRAMQAEKWLNATEAVAFGLADRIFDPSRRAVAMAPKRIVARLKPAASAMATWRAAVVACGGVSQANKQNPGLREKMLREVNGR